MYSSKEYTLITQCILLDMGKDTEVSFLLFSVTRYNYPKRRLGC